jgi:hypothetical protein
MNHNERAPNSAMDSRLELDNSLPVMTAAGVEASVTVAPSDRVYQVAAMTAGIFLLATLL